jgi:hypothetical protein
MFNFSQMKKYTLILSVIIFFCGCEEKFDPQLAPYKAKIVCNDLFEQGQPFNITVSHSVSIFDQSKNPDYNNDATVKLFVNDVLTETVANSGALGVYQASTVPVPGKTYKVVVSVPGFDDAEAVNTLPLPVAVQNWSYKDSTLSKIDISGTETWYGSLKFTINDPPSNNKYMLSVKFHDPISGEYVFISTINSDDEALSETFARRLENGEYIFRDTPFNGKSKTFEILVPSGLIFTPDYLLSFYTLSDDAFLFYYSQPTGLNSESSLYNNVKKGLGIFAGRSLVTDTIR